MIRGQNIRFEVVRGVIHQVSRPPLRSTDGVHADSAYLIMPRVACRASYIVLARALALSKETRLADVVVPLIHAANFYHRQGNAGRSENLDHDLITLNHGSPQATRLAAIAGGVRTFHVLVFGIVDPELCSLGHFKARNA